jgi:hypothetical protein
LTRDSRIELLSFECSLSIFGHPKSTEHPHKLPDRIVKELPGIFVRERPPILLDRALVSSLNLTFFKLAVKPGPLESAYFTVRLVIVNNYLDTSFALRFSPANALKHQRERRALYVHRKHRQ